MGLTIKGKKLSALKQKIQNDITKSEQAQAVKKQKISKKKDSKDMASKFRWLNEKLYTCHSKDSLKYFAENPEMFKIYHDGFSSQAKSWPSNPNDIFIGKIQQISKVIPHKLSVADLGCGEAKIACEFLNQQDKLTLHSFDLCAPVTNPELVTICDISKVPLKAETVDIAIFSLSLMGTNHVDFIKESNRILKKDGKLWIAEVVSRIGNMDDFISGICSLGFKLKSKNDKNKMFVLLDFVKTAEVGKLKKTAPNKPLLNPCVYKKR